LIFNYITQIFKIVVDEYFLFFQEFNRRANV